MNVSWHLPCLPTPSCVYMRQQVKAVPKMDGRVFRDAIRWPMHLGRRRRKVRSESIYGHCLARSIRSNGPRRSMCLPRLASSSNTQAKARMTDSQRRCFNWAPSQWRLPVTLFLASIGWFRSLEIQLRMLVLCLQNRPSPSSPALDSIVLRHGVWHEAFSWSLIILTP